MKTLDDFNPNSKQPPLIEYATYVPERSTAPAFKVHKRRSDAISALTDNSILYRFINNEWKEILRLDNWQPPHNCDLCGELTAIQREGNSWQNGQLVTGSYYSHRGYRRYEDTDTNHPKIVWLCYSCNRKRKR